MHVYKRYVTGHTYTQMGTRVNPLLTKWESSRKNLAVFYNTGQKFTLCIYEHCNLHQTCTHPCSFSTLILKCIYRWWFTISFAQLKHQTVNLTSVIKCHNLKHSSDYILKRLTKEILNKIQTLLCPPGKRKLAVANSTSVSLGIGFLPSAIPTMAVMCVSGPNTYRGIPRFWPTSLMILKTIITCYTQLSSIKL